MDETIADSDVSERHYAAETALLVSQQLPAVVLVFITIFGGAGVFEYLSHPQRVRLYMNVLVIQVCVFLTALVLTRYRRWQRAAIPITACATALICALIAMYHLMAKGEAEILALALIGVTTCVAVLIPLGGWGQLVVAAAACTSYIAAVLFGVKGANSVWMVGTALWSISALSVAGAFFLNRYRYAAFRRADELQRVNAALETANATKNAFLASVSHELRTPLNVVIGYVQMILDGSLGDIPDAALDPLKRIAVNAETLVYLISDLLDLSRMEAGRLTVHVVRVELAPVFDDLSEFARGLIGDRPIDFHCANVGPLAVSADRERLKQILSNLLSNAIKYTPEGDVRLSAYRLPTGQIEIQVADTGIGIAEDELRQIFEPFHRSSNAAQVGGVGIGLSVSDLMTRLIGGELSVDSVPDQGSIFRVRLQPPALQEEVKAENLDTPNRGVMRL